MEVTLTILYLVIGLVSLGFYYLKRHLSYWTRRGIPHDEPSYFDGNMQGFDKTRHIRDIIQDYYNKFKGSGPFAGMHFFFKPAVILLDLDLVRNVLIKDFNNFPDRGDFYNEIDDPLSGHLFAIDGEKWKRLRRKLTPTFTSGKMKYMFPTVISVVDQLVTSLDILVKENSVVEIKDLMARFTIDVIGTCAFGIECNSLKERDAEFCRMGVKAVETKRHTGLIEFLKLSYPKFARKLRLCHIRDDVSDFYMRVVRETIDFRERSSSPRNDFMDLLIDIKNGEEGLTFDEVAAQSFIFFVAGFETSSTTMSFALFELALNQDIQDKMRAEIDEEFEKNGNKLIYESLTELRYTEKVFKETLRKYAAISILNRDCEADYQTSDPKYVIPKGAHVIIPVDAIHHDPDIYPDPERFDPNRFDPEEIKKRHPTTWLPFGDGPRNCIALRFGKMQVSLGLAILIRNYKFSYCNKTPIPLEYQLGLPTLNAKGGMYLKVEKIR